MAPARILAPTQSRASVSMQKLRHRPGVARPSCRRAVASVMSSSTSPVAARRRRWSAGWPRTSSAALQVPGAGVPADAGGDGAHRLARPVGGRAGRGHDAFRVPAGRSAEHRPAAAPSAPPAPPSTSSRSTAAKLVLAASRQLQRLAARQAWHREGHRADDDRAQRHDHAQGRGEARIAACTWPAASASRTASATGSGFSCGTKCPAPGTTWRATNFGNGALSAGDFGGTPKPVVTPVEQRPSAPAPAAGRPAPSPCRRSAARSVR